MTDSEKLDFLIEKVNKLDFLIEKVNKLDFLIEKVNNLGTEMNDVKADISNVKRQLVKSTAELKDMDESILNEVERVHRILEEHMRDRSVHTA